MSLLSSCFTAYAPGISGLTFARSLVGDLPCETGTRTLTAVRCDNGAIA